jgi:hypothetical protein
MQKGTLSIKIFSALIVLAFLAAFATGASPALAPEKTPANVAGTWAVQLAGEVGTGTQRFDLTQTDDGVSGTFQGPYQKGKIEGSLDGNAIKLQLSGNFPLRYKGTVAGDSMGGTVNGGTQGKSGTWTAHRTKHI